jgi:two-component system chemotaxis sensor kinase CheA
VDRLTQEFLAESFEGLDRVDRCLTELEARPEDAELVAEIFRALHTMKGTTAFLGYGRAERLAHAGEQLIGHLRSGRMRATPEVVSGLLKLMDALRAIVRLIERTGREGERAEQDSDTGLLRLLAELGGEVEAAAPAERKEAATPGGGETKSAPGAGMLGLGGSGPSEKTLRIDVEVLNRMMNLVGELVLTRNQMLRSQVDAASFPALARRLDTVTADLRETVMQARMQPVAHLFGKLPRMVRDLALSCGKSVRLELSGQETGLDKSLLEAIKDPLTHAVRNAVDHGIEDPLVRIAAGKPAQGVIRLRACHCSGWVVIEMEDDGAGIARGQVLAKAIERGLVTEEQAARMSDREALQMIFLPGFSTARAVTHLSGRGVGMDVVKNNVERVGGTVEIESRVGLGTIVRMRVPLTLAIVPALVVETIGSAQVFRLRDSLLPMVSLDRILEIEDRGRARPAHGFYLAVLEAEGCRFGLAVDDLLAPEEIVVKPLTSGLREIGMFSGATVLGNGTLAMILDVAATAIRAGVRPMVERLNAVVPAVAEESARPEFLVFEGPGNSRQAERVAFPLHLVERIENVLVTEVEWAGGRPRLQYRGELLSLEDAGGVLGELADGDRPAGLTVVICRTAPGGPDRQRRVGMIVRRVLDVASGAMVRDEEGIGEARLALVKGRVTVVHEEFGDVTWREVA